MAWVVGLLPNAGDEIAGGFRGARLAWDNNFMDTIVEKAGVNKREIHGNKYQASSADFSQALTFEEFSFITSLEHACRSHGVQEFPGMGTWRPINFMVLWGPPGTACQEWHMDAWEKDIMVGTLIVSGKPNPTELANIVYRPIDVEEDDPEAMAKALELPLDWSTIEPIRRIAEWHMPKALILFKGDAMHRGPAVPEEDPTRVSIYISWGRQGISTKTFVDNTCFNARRPEGTGGQREPQGTQGTQGRPEGTGGKREPQGTQGTQGRPEGTGGQREPQGTPRRRVTQQTRRSQVGCLSLCSLSLFLYACVCVCVCVSPSLCCHAWGAGREGRAHCLRSSCPPSPHQTLIYLENDLSKYAQGYEWLSSSAKELSAADGTTYQRS
jgi:hypothetical protein